MQTEYRNGTNAVAHNESVATVTNEEIAIPIVTNPETYLLLTATTNCCLTIGAFKESFLNARANRQHVNRYVAKSSKRSKIGNKVVFHTRPPSAHRYTHIYEYIIYSICVGTYYCKKKRKSC